MEMMNAMASIVWIPMLLISKPMLISSIPRHLHLLEMGFLQDHA